MDPPLIWAGSFIFHLEVVAHLKPSWLVCFLLAVKLWSTNQERSVACLEAKANVCCVKFNPSKMYSLAFGSADHCVHYYDLRYPKQPLNVFKGHKKAVSYTKFVNSEEIVSA